jgi:hypothetical protein
MLMLEDIEKQMEKHRIERRRQVILNIIYFTLGIMLGIVSLRTWIIYKYGFVVF